MDGGSSSRARGEKVSTFARELRALGAEAIEFPTIATVAADSYATLDPSIARLDAFDWIIFTSATGVEAFIGRLKTLQKDIRAMGAARLAAIGPATAAALKEYALLVDAMPSEYRGEAIIEAIGADENSRRAHPDSARADRTRSFADDAAREGSCGGGRRAGL